ncbi:MAG: hypothetical protein AMXMBFR64_62230 [Myxococcales bacterium]
MKGVSGVGEGWRGGTILRAGFAESGSGRRALRLLRATSDLLRLFRRACLCPVGQAGTVVGRNGTGRVEREARDARAQGLRGEAPPRKLLDRAPGARRLLG